MFPPMSQLSLFGRVKGSEALREDGVPACRSEAWIPIAGPQAGPLLSDTAREILPIHLIIGLGRLIFTMRRLFRMEVYALTRRVLLCRDAFDAL
jgi:hypothetical protein